MIYLGIDPGKSGAIAWSYDGLDDEPFVLATAKYTEAELGGAIASLMLDCKEFGRLVAVVEQVSSSPQMGVTSAFTFGRSFGFWLGCLAGIEVPHALVRPQKWQKAMGCLSKGDKNVTKAAAHRLYPKTKPTHATADALLLATYCRRHHHELF